MFELTFFLSSLESRLVSGSFWLESDTQRETHIFLTGKDLLIVLLLLRSSHCVRTFFWQSLANLPSEIWKNKNYCAESLTGSWFFWWIGEAWIVEPLWILKIMHRVSVIKNLVVVNRCRWCCCCCRGRGLHAGRYILKDVWAFFNKFNTRLLLTV